MPQWSPTRGHEDKRSTVRSQFGTGRPSETEGEAESSKALVRGQEHLHLPRVYRARSAGVHERSLVHARAPVPLVVRDADPHGPVTLPAPAVVEHKPYLVHAAIAPAAAFGPLGGGRRVDTNAVRAAIGVVAVLSRSDHGFVLADARDAEGHRITVGIDDPPDGDGDESMVWRP